MPGSGQVERLHPGLSTVEALVLDIDGVLYEGIRVLPGAVELIASLNRRGLPYVLLSNNTTRTLHEHVSRLSSLSMPVPATAILTAARITAEVLAREAAPGTRCLVIGEAGLIEALEEAGFELAQRDGCGAAYVVVGLDRRLSFEKLKLAARAIWNGAELISSNPDLVYPDADGLIPASGAIQTALEAATGVRARVIGKPELPGFQIALQNLGCEPSRTAILGDQLEVDILGGLRAGILTCLVLSSITPSFSPEAAPYQPHRVFKSTLDFYLNWTAEKDID